MSKIPYEKISDGYCGFYYKQVVLTGKCKTITGGPIHQNGTNYRQVQRFLFRMPIWKSWVCSNKICFFEETKEKIYDCSCGEENDS